MISRSRSIAGALLAFLLATSLPAVAAVGMPSLFGKKKPTQDTMPGRKPTAAQYALIDKAILREKEVDVYKRQGHRRPLAVAQVVVDRHSIPARQQKPRHRPADIPCTTCYQNPHRFSPRSFAATTKV